MKKAFFILLICSSIFSLLFAQKPIKDLKPTVILISLDGFRYDYLEKYRPTVLNELAKKGVRAKWMTPAFPSKTFPNHYTIATGLYPENHGIVENNIYDRSFDAVFSLGKREEVQNGRWWLGEPIWVTAEKQGQRAGTFFFPGTEAEIAGIRPTFWKQYEHNLPNETRVDTILSWLDLPQSERPTFLTLYFADVDDAGHGFGPDSVETRQAVLKIDENLARLVEGLNGRKIDKKVNLIIVSDHGMATLNQQNAVLLDDYFDFDKAVRILWTNEIVQIFPKDGMQREIFDRLQKIQKNAKCYDKQTMSERFHFTKSARIAPIICLADEGWMLTSRERYENLKRLASFVKPKGAHGYDNELESMRAIFIAHGGAFKKKKIIEPFANIHVYNVMTKILSLRPAKNDGNFKLANQILR